MTNETLIAAAGLARRTLSPGNSEALAKHGRARQASGIGQSDDYDHQAARIMWADGARELPADILVTEETIAGVPVLRLRPQQLNETAPLIISFHGGAYVAGDFKSHGQIAGWLAKELSAETIFVDYRLAPEHPFPAAYDDAIAVVKEIAALEKTFVLHGDSVGAALALAGAVSLRDGGLHQPLAVLLTCPMLDHHPETSASLLGAAYARAMAALYVPATQADDPRASPLNYDLHGLPPLFVQVGGPLDACRDDSIRLVNKAFEQNVAISFEHWPLQSHSWHRYAPDAPEALEGIRHIANFVRSLHA